MCVTNRYEWNTHDVAKHHASMLYIYHALILLWYINKGCTGCCLSNTRGLRANRAIIGRGSFFALSHQVLEKHVYIGLSLFPFWHETHNLIIFWPDSLTRSLAHSLTDSLTHWLTHPPTHSLTHSLNPPSFSLSLSLSLNWLTCQGTDILFIAMLMRAVPPPPPPLRCVASY